MTRPDHVSEIDWALSLAGRLPGVAVNPAPNGWALVNAETGEVLRGESGDLRYATLPGLISALEAMVGRRPCPDCGDDGLVVVGWNADAYENVEGPCPRRCPASMAWREVKP